MTNAARLACRCSLDDLTAGYQPPFAQTRHYLSFVTDDCWHIVILGVLDLVSVI